MSQVNISLDTVTDEFQVTVDGEVLDNVSDVSIYCNEPYDSDGDEIVSISIGVTEKPENKNDLRRHIRLNASSKEDLKESVDEEKPVHGEINKFMTHLRR